MLFTRRAPRPAMDAPEQYEDALEDVTEKDLLLEIMAELKTIRYGLQTGDFGTLDGDTESESEPRYRCDNCTKVVTESERQAHLVDQHNAPPEIPLEGEFSEV